MRAILRHRILTSVTVDPDEAAARLPAPLRPHVVGGGTVIGCCVLELDHLWAGPVPAPVRLRSMAVRISAEWDTPDGVEVGVYVPLRQTDSPVAAAIGGRLVPGVQRRADLGMRTVAGASSKRFEVLVGDRSMPGHVRLSASVAPAGGGGPAACDVVGTCVAARVGLSPGRRGGFDAMRMDLDDPVVEPLVLHEFVSPFVDSFRSAGEATSFVMRSTVVRWARAWSPAPGAQVAAAASRSDANWEAIAT